MAPIEDDDEMPYVYTSNQTHVYAKQRRQLSVGALDALKEFYGERDARQKQFEELKEQAEDDFEGKLSMEAFTEDWNASQFWV